MSKDREPLEWKSLVRYNRSKKHIKKSSDKQTNKRNFICKFFCKHKYKNIAILPIAPGNKLLTGEEFVYKCQKCGKIRVFSTKWW